MTTVEAPLGVAPAAERTGTRVWHGWSSIALVAIALLAAGLNLWGLQRVGYGNSYYAAAVLSMLQNWHNFFFVSFDPGGFVSIDKPPLGFWIQAASAKVLGFSGVAILLPEALAGVGSVLLTYHLVKRAFGTGAGLLAALMLAFTPVSVSVSRNNTIDSLLVFTLLLATWAAFKAVERGSLVWLLVSAAVVGLGFEIKMLEAYLVVPALGLVYLVAAPRRWLVRLGHLALATLVLLSVSFAWPVAVDLTPASQRPWVDSTQDNSAVDLALGYNGIQRLLGRNASLDLSAIASGNAAQQGFGGPGGRQENGTPGPLRLIDEQLGPQASWLLSLSLAGLVVSGLAAWQFRKRLSTSRQAQSFFVWGTWLLTAGAFFSVAEYFHSYYLVTLGPPVAALAAIGTVGGWRALCNGTRLAWLLPVALVLGGLLEGRLLVPYADGPYSWLAPLAIGVSVLSAIALVGAWIVQRFDRRGIVQLVTGAAALGVVALLMAPAVWAAMPALGEGGGMLPSAVGPRGGANFGPGRGGPPAPGVRGGPGAIAGRGTQAPGSGAGAAGGQPPAGATGGTRGAAGFGGPNGAGAAQAPAGADAAGGQGAAAGAGAASAAADGGPGGATGGPGAGGGPGAFGFGRGGGANEQELIDYLETNQGSSKFLVATSNSNSAA
ncbi:MAG: glycosyltransferase family 39 protein, partial [Chloroflexi bacterium]|nr:glycosyltransferase family 39 protein [Chloroflexota bacterium]